MGFSDRFTQRKRRWGLRRALHWQLMQLLDWLIGLRLHYVFLGSGSGRLDRMPAPPIPPGYRVQMVGLDELLPHAGRVPDLEADFLYAAFGQGDVCVASFHGEDLVGFSFQTGFRSSGRARVSDQLDIVIPEGFRYTYKTWIRDDHRQRNLSQIQGYVRHVARPPEDRRRGIWYAETHNYPSLLHGYRHPNDRALAMGLIGWVSVFGRHVPFRSPRAQWIGVELARRADRRPRKYVR